MDTEWIMRAASRRFIQRASALFLVLAAVAGLWIDVTGLFAAGSLRGPAEHAPYSGVLFMAIHGLVFGIAVVLWRAEPSGARHRFATAVHVFLSLVNLLFWPILVATAPWLGYPITVLHVVFAELQLAAAAAEDWARQSRSPALPAEATAPAAKRAGLSDEKITASRKPDHAAGARDDGCWPTQIGPQRQARFESAYDSRRA